MFCNVSMCQFFPRNPMLLFQWIPPSNRIKKVPFLFFNAPKDLLIPPFQLASKKKFSLSLSCCPGFPKTWNWDHQLPINFLKPGCRNYSFSNLKSLGSDFGSFPFNKIETLSNTDRRRDSPFEKGNISSHFKDKRNLPSLLSLGNSCMLNQINWRPPMGRSLIPLLSMNSKKPCILPVLLPPTFLLSGSSTSLKLSQVSYKATNFWTSLVNCKTVN